MLDTDWLIQKYSSRDWLSGGLRNEIIISMD